MQIFLTYMTLSVIIKNYIKYLIIVVLALKAICVLHYGGAFWFRRGQVGFEKRVEGTCGPALKNYGV